MKSQAQGGSFMLMGFASIKTEPVDVKTGQSPPKSPAAGPCNSRAGADTGVTVTTMTAGIAAAAALPVVPPPPQTAAEVQPPRQVYSYVAKNDVLQAEILWTLKTVVDHSSYRSNKDIEKYMAKMFPDSHIAKWFTCGERKNCLYMCLWYCWTLQKSKPAVY